MPRASFGADEECPALTFELSAAAPSNVSVDAVLPRGPRRSTLRENNGSGSTVPRLAVVPEQLFLRHVAQDPGRVSDHDHSRRYVPDHDGTSADEGLLADLDPWQ